MRNRTRGLYTRTLGDALYHIVYTKHPPPGTPGYNSRIPSAMTSRSATPPPAERCINTSQIRYATTQRASPLSAQMVTAKKKVNNRASNLRREATGRRRQRFKTKKRNHASRLEDEQKTPHKKRTVKKNKKKDNASAPNGGKYQENCWDKAS